MASNNNPENSMDIRGDVPPPAPSAAVPARPLIQDYGSDNNSNIGNCAPNSTPPRSAPVAPLVPYISTPGGSASTVIQATLDTKAGNWTQWSRLMTYLFISFEVKNIVSRQVICPDPVQDPEGTKNWMYNDNYTQMLITTNISKNLMIHTQGCPTMYNMWLTPRAIFERSPDLDYTKQLHTIFENCTYEGSNIVDHLTKLKSNWNNIPIYSNLCSLQADALFKCIIAATLLCSWDAFTRPYVQGSIDQTDKDSNKHVDSQLLIGLIN